MLILIYYAIYYAIYYVIGGIVVLFTLKHNRKHTICMKLRFRKFGFLYGCAKLQINIRTIIWLRKNLVQLLS